MKHSLGLGSLPDDELLRRLSTLVNEQRRHEAEVVAHIAEVDARRLYLARACTSMHAYCCEVLHLSEHEAYLRIACARASRRFPVVLEMLGDGRLHLSAIAKLARHLSEENAETLLGRAIHKSKREIEELLAEVAPRQDVPPEMRRWPTRPTPVALGRPDRVPGATSSNAVASASSPPASAPSDAADSGAVAPGSSCPASASPPRARPAVLEPIAPARYKVQFTAGAELHDKLSRARALLRHKQPDCDLAEVVDEAVTLLLAKLEGRRFGKTDAPRKTLAETDTSATSRHVPAAVKRAVFDRDGGRCTFVDERTGRRCACADPGKLEYHHTTPFALDPDHDPAQITLRCMAHNQYQAELDFGCETMSRCRTSRAREPRAVYGPRPVAPSSEQCLAKSRQVESPIAEGPPGAGLTPLAETAALPKDRLAIAFLIKGEDGPHRSAVGCDQGLLPGQGTEAAWQQGRATLERPSRRDERCALGSTDGRTMGGHAQALPSISDLSSPVSEVV